jgi:hypothetical protein
MYVELAEEILHARPVTEEEAKAALERAGVRNGIALSAWIEKRRGCSGLLRSAGSSGEGHPRSEGTASGPDVSTASNAERSPHPR